MKTLKCLTIFYFLLSIIITGNTQNTKTVTDLQSKFSNNEPVNKSLNHSNYFNSMSSEMAFSHGSEMKLEKTITGANGTNHYKFKQFYEGLPLIGNIYILHEKNDLITSSNGLYTPYLNLNTTPAMEENIVALRARSIMRRDLADNSQYYLHDIINDGPPLLCIIDQAYPKNSGNMKLAYQIDLISTEPFNKIRYFLDANTGFLIKSLPLIKEHGVPSKANTRYYGVQDVITDSIAPDIFLLRDNTRGEGISVKGKEGNLFSSNTKNWDLNNGKKDEVALDAIYSAEKYYDLLLERFDWSGLDGQGSELNIKIHKNEAGSVNAFWDGKSANFGDGNCTNGPLTTHEVLGHEFTHGLIDFTSDLIYSGESGAINESIADMFGKALEYNADPSRFSWTIGSSFKTNPSSLPFRIMEDPTKLKMPQYYRGNYWFDENDVHVNSSIGNLWFVILSDGRTGINEANEQFNINGIGIEKAHRIIFLANNAYNIPTTDYNELRQNTLKAAEELYGINSTEWNAVNESWKAVGLPVSKFILSKDLGITFSPNYLNSCELQEYVPFSITVTNYGSMDYLPGPSRYLLLYGNVNRKIKLEDTILSGESKIFLVNDYLKYFGFPIPSLHAELIYDDDNISNNISTLFIHFSEYGENDLNAQIYTVDDYGCNNTSKEIEIYLTNNSCNIIKEGTNLTLKVWDEDNNLSWSQDLILPSDIYPNKYFFTTFNLQLDFKGESRFKLEVLFPEDPNPADNSAYLYLNNLASINDSYFQDFDQLPNNKEKLRIQTNQPLVPINYNGELYLGFTGFTADTTAKEKCFIPEEIFSEDPYYFTTVSACVDLSDAETSQLEFDMVLFKNKYAEINNFPYSSLIEVSWEGNEAQSQFIYDAPEGIRKHYSFELPEYFMGQFSIKIFTSLGQYEITDSSFLNDDVVLIDDLRINKFTSNSKDIQESTFSIFPNPALDILNIVIPVAAVGGKILVTDILGRVVLTEPTNVNSIDVSKLNPGVYCVKCLKHGNSYETFKFIKI